MSAASIDLWELPSSGDCPWIGAEHSYAGWVPNVSGHLSFNLVDPHSGLPTYNYQLQLSSPRIVALHRERLAQDYPFPDWLMRRVRKSARQDFVLLAESCSVTTPMIKDGKPKPIEDQNGALVGVVAILPSESIRRTRRLRSRLLSKIDGVISDAISEYAAGQNVQRRVAQEVLSEIDQSRSQVACYLLRFALFRTGELRIWFDLADFLGRDLAAEPPLADEVRAADHIAPHAYYFIKDLLHAHYHHDPKSDQLLPLTRLSAHTNQLEADELSWRYATLRGLARVVVELRQARSLTGHKRAIGIIAYAQAFQSVLARITRHRHIDGPYELSEKIMPYDFSNLVTSIDAVDAINQSAITARLQLFAIVIGILLSGLALWAGAVQVQPVLCQAIDSTDACQKITAGPSVTALNWVIANPTAFITALIVLGFAAFVAFFRGTGAIPFAERFIRWSERLAEAIAADVSGKTGRSDGLGLAIGLLAMVVPIGFATGLAWHLTPTRPVAALEALGPDRRGRWDSLATHVNQRITESGLLFSSPIAPELRNLLGARFADLVRLFGADAVLRSEGPLLFVIPEKTNPGADAAYLIIDRSSDRFEVGVRVNGHAQVYRTAGHQLPRPKAVRELMGSSLADVASVAAEKSTCVIEQTGDGSRIIQVSGLLRAGEFCEYSLELREGQSMAFDRERARGLVVVAREGGRQIRVDPIFTPKRAGLIPIRVGWDGWRPKKSDSLRPRKFYVRLELH